jgi:MCRA family
MSNLSKAYLLGGGIGSLAAAAFMIRDGAFSGETIWLMFRCSGDMPCFPIELGILYPNRWMNAMVPKSCKNFAVISASI